MTQEKLKSILKYNPDTGVFIWIKTGRGRRLDKVAGGIKRDGYIYIHIKGRDYGAHRLAWLYIYGELPKEHIDHINHDRIDNRLSNIRAVTLKENAKNKTTLKNNTSGVTGVSWSKAVNRWGAYIQVDSKQIYLGSFEEFSDAVNARKNAEALYGFHENHGKDI